MSFNTLLNHFEQILAPALAQTLYMSIIATAAGSVLGLALGILLYATDRRGVCEQRSFYAVLDLVINIFRSFPFLVLIIVLIPFTKFLLGKSIGTTAAIIPLIIGIAPFFAKVAQSALASVDYGVVEAAKSFGATRSQIIFRVVLPEALPALFNAITLTLIVIIGYSALAGTVGGGGLGDVAIRYGYQRFRTDIMIETVVLLVLLVQAVQISGDLVQRRLARGRNAALYIWLALVALICAISAVYA